MGSARNSKRIAGSEYKYVSEFKNNEGGNIFFRACKEIKGKYFTVSHSTAKGAALALDKKLIESGLEPINILKKISA